MMLRELMDEMRRLGVTIEVHDQQLRYEPRLAVTPELVEQMKAHKPALRAHLLSRPWELDVTDEENEANWRAISQADRDYLLGPRDWPDACPWCGGRLIHSKVCEDLRRELVPVVPFKQFRGRRADEVPPDYIDWILSNGAGSEGFRDELRRWRDTTLGHRPDGRR